MRRLATLLFYLCVFGGLAEFTLRYYFSGVSPFLIQSSSPQVLGGFLPKQSIVLRDLDVQAPFARVVINEDGVRSGGNGEAESLKATVAKSAKIICVGDENTFGLGVGDEETYPTILRGLMQTRAKAPYQIVNAGVANFSPADEQNFIKNKFKR